jgi:pimeloyl-ACP methyl ester carboxylesterase
MWQEHSFNYRGTSFSARSKGKGPSIIFLHGFLENQTMWEQLIEQLPSRYRCITLDLPGHGEAANLGYVHSMLEMAEMVKSLVDSLKLRKVNLIGHSMGGYVALSFAELYPDAIKSLVLMNSTARADSEERRLNRDRAIALVKQNAKSYVRTAIPLLFRPKSRKEYGQAVKLVKMQALKTSPQGIVAALEGMKNRFDREVILHFAPYPILMVAAKHDPVIALESIEDQIAGSAVELWLTENGHMSHIEDFPLLLQGLKSFWQKVLG